MHSSRMRTTHSSSCWGVWLSMLGYTPWVWVWRPPLPGRGPGDPPGVGLESPTGVGLETPHPQARLLNLPLECGPGAPPWPDHSASHLGVGLETCKACWDITPWRSAARHTGIPPAMHTEIPYPPPPVKRITDMCKNIILPQLRCDR